MSNHPNTLGRFIEALVRAGNKLPHPTALFIWLCVAVVLCSWLFTEIGVRATHPVTKEIYAVENLLSVSGIDRLLQNAVSNFTSFAPVGVVLVMMLGIGIAEKSGLIGALLQKLVRVTSRSLLAYVIAFCGVMSSLGADVGYVVLIPLAGMVYHAQGRPALAGIAVAFAGVSAGYSANLFIGPVDLILSSLSSEAAALIDSQVGVAATDNYYFIVVSTFIITLVCGAISNRWIEPHLAQQQTIEHAKEAEQENIDEQSNHRFMPVTIFTLLFITSLLLLAYPGVQANDGTDHFSLLKNIVPLLALFFGLAGYIFGRSNGAFSSSASAIGAMEEAMQTMAYYIVLMFFAAQFVSLFSWTNIGVVTAIKGASVLGELSLPPLLVLPLFIILSASINLLIGSASAKWALLAPVFVPMLMLLGLPPEQTQVAYRVGDSATNIISPLMPYFGIVLAYAQRYRASLGMGDVIGMMLPYSLALMLIWGILTTVWIGLGIPLGPTV